MKFFGTDGIRKKADEFTPEFLYKIARGLVDYAGNDIKVLLGGDTRESSEWILADLETAFESLGVEFSNVGVLSTPALNYCFYQMGFDCAIDVTASHNPYTDNGIKIFVRGEKFGVKLPPEGCEKIEASLLADADYEPVSPALREDLHSEALELYSEHLKAYLGTADLEGLSLGLDCANGATSVLGKIPFEALGAKVKLINAEKSYARKINAACGSTHLESLKSLVVENSLDFGIAFDGDGDRVLLVDESGETVDGDEIIAILADYFGLNHIAVTVMANQGLLNWAAKNNIKTEITPVGDSNVFAAMQEKDLKLGGEQSGHIILPNEPTGDGLLTALMIAKIVKESKKSLGTLAKIIHKLPQVIVNLDVTSEQKAAFETSADATSIISHFSEKVKEEHGRLLVRPSGTENLIRITVWGESETVIRNLAANLKEELKEAL